MNAVAMPLFGQALTDPVGHTHPSKRNIPGPQKAAVIVRLLLSDGVALPLHELPDQMQGHLTEHIASLSAIDRDTVRAIVEEFVARIEAVGLSFKGGIEGALQLLEGHISEETMARMRRRASRRGDVEDPWAKLAGMESDKLATAIGAESPEVAAVALSKLPVQKAAEILSALPGDVARRIAFTMSQTDGVDAETVERIGLALAEGFAAEPEKTFTEGPVERVGAILNFSPASARDALIRGLEETDTDFAEKVKKAIFTFAHIPARIQPRDVPRILRNVDQAKLVTALAGAKGEDEVAATFILDNVSQRMAASLREEMAARGSVKEKDLDAAMLAVVSAIRQLEADGEITQIAEDDEA